MRINLWVLFLSAMALLLGAGPKSRAQNENVLVFDEAGGFLKSYSVGDYTTGIDATMIDYEEYNPGSPPSLSGTGSEPYAYSAGEVWVPNDLGGIFPAPVGGLPPVSLYSFGEAVLSFESPGVPGLAINPATGTYNHTIEVALTAYPGSAAVEIFNPDLAAWETFGNQKSILLAQSGSLLVRANDGGMMSAEKTLVYTIDQDPDADTDKDTIPDLIEILLERFDPFVTDAGLDTDKDGWPDIDEILRGSDPDRGDQDGDGWSDEDEMNMGTSPLDPEDFPAGPPPVYMPPLEPQDTDGDEWADLDETWRGTNIADASDYPTARWLYEVEMLADGQFSSHTPCGGCQNRLSITDHGADAPTLVRDLAGNTFTDLRAPRGTHSVLRLAVQEVEVVGDATQVSNTWSSRKLLEALLDPTPAEIPSASWYTGAKGPSDPVADWLLAWQDLLANRLLEDLDDLQVDPEDNAPVALFDALYTYVSGAQENEYVILGRMGWGPDAVAVQEVKDRLLAPVQVPPATPVAQKNFHELTHTVQQLAVYTGAETQVAGLYAGYAPGQDLELTLAQVISSVTYTYPAVLATSLSFAEMQTTGVPLPELLTHTQDLEPDGLPNFVEALGYLNGWETNIFEEDSDSDGVPDPFDNCPWTVNPSQEDNDSDGYGDACDPDDDNDGLEDVFEDLQMSDPFVADTDGDGYNDGDENDMALDAGDGMDSLYYAASVNAGPTFMTETFPTSIASAPHVLAGPGSLNAGLLWQPDLRAITGANLELRAEKDPSEAGNLVEEQVSLFAFSPKPDAWNAGTVIATEEWQEVLFELPYPIGSKPLVFATVQSEFTTTTTLHVDVDEITSSGFKVLVRGNTGLPDPGPLSERVAFAAFLPGTQIPGGGENGETIAGGSIQSVLFAQEFETDPVVLVSIEGGGLQMEVTSVSSTGFQVQPSFDAAMGGAPPDSRVSWVALGTPVCEDPDMDGVCSHEDNAPNIYNPDQLDSDGDGSSNIEEFLLGTDMFDPNSTPSTADAEALLVLLGMNPTPEELFEFASMWMTMNP